MARRVRLVRRKNAAPELPYGEWIPAHAVKFNTDGTTQIMTEDRHANPRRRRRRNVAAGFWDDTGFHPIRASYDYSPKRAGERVKRKAKRKKAKRRRR